MLRVARSASKDQATMDAQMDRPKGENYTTRTPKNMAKWIQNIYGKIEKKNVGKIGTKTIRKMRSKKLTKCVSKDWKNAFQKIEKMRSKGLKKCVPKSWSNAFQKYLPKKILRPTCASESPFSVIMDPKMRSKKLKKCVPKSWQNAFQKVDKMRFKRLTKCVPKDWKNWFQKNEKCVPKNAKTWGDIAVHLCISRPPYRSHCYWASSLRALQSWYFAGIAPHPICGITHCAHIPSPDLRRFGPGPPGYGDQNSMVIFLAIFLVSWFFIFYPMWV